MKDHSHCRSSLDYVWQQKIERNHAANLPKSTWALVQVLPQLSCPNPAALFLFCCCHDPCHKLILKPSSFIMVSGYPTCFSWCLRRTFLQCQTEFCWMSLLQSLVCNLSPVSHCEVNHTPVCLLMFPLSRGSRPTLLCMLDSLRDLDTPSSVYWDSPQVVVFNCPDC